MRSEEIMACVRRVEELREDPDFVRYYDYEESHKQDLEARNSQNYVE